MSIGLILSPHLLLFPVSTSGETDADPQLNVRVPSMLIRRDGLMASPYPGSYNFEKLLSSKTAPAMAGYSLNPIQQHEAMQKERIDRQKTELLSKARGTLNPNEMVASRMLQLQE
jgi:hypothetical protein